MTKPPTAEVLPAICAVCDAKAGYRWTDTHGVGACLNCGAPYQLFHYEKDANGESNRIPSEPVWLSKCLIKPSWLAITRRYWREVGRNVNPGGFNFPGSTYEVATKEDFLSMNDWFAAHKDEWPQEQEA